MLRLHQENVLSLDEVTQIFLITENYIFRRLICDLPTNMLNKIFLVLHKEIMRYDGTPAQYLDKFKCAMLSKKERARFPDDVEFVEAFSAKPMYLMNSKNKHYLFERLENHGTTEDKAVWDHIDHGDYSIEHIMPQHLTPAWVEALGENYADIHETWLHRIANLTLTAYNSKYSNNTFAEKRDMKNGFKDSGIRMNQRIAQKEAWGLAELQERDEQLKERALDIWATPITAYVAPSKELDSFTLDDDVDFTGKTIARFSYKGIEQPVNSWIDMYQQVLKILHAEDKSVLSSLAYSSAEEADLAMHVSSNENEFTKSIEIEPGIYIWSNTNTQYKLSLLRKFFTLYNADPDDLVFFMKDEVDEDAALVSSRFEIRRKYWAYALPIIKQAHADTGCFSGCIGSKDNWISGYYGIRGCSILCVANYGLARIEFYISREDKNFSKTVFDYLYAHKNEIEQKLGVPLIWYRGDGFKVSKVMYELKGVTITNEDDWARMAQFHSTWSKKFHDAMVGYVFEITQ